MSSILPQPPKSARPPPAAGHPSSPHRGASSVVIRVVGTLFGTLGGFCLVLDEGRYFSTLNFWNLVLYGEHNFLQEVQRPSVHVPGPLTGAPENGLLLTGFGWASARTHRGAAHLLRGTVIPPWSPWGFTHPLFRFSRWSALPGTGGFYRQGDTVMFPSHCLLCAMPVVFFFFLLIFIIFVQYEIQDHICLKESTCVCIYFIIRHTK